MKIIKYLILFILLLFIIECKRLQKFNNLPIEHQKLIFQTSNKIDTYKELEKEGLLSTIMAKKKINEELSKLRSIITEEFDLEKIEMTQEFFESLNEANEAKQSTLKKITGFFTFINIVWFIATVILVVAVVALFGIYVVPIIIQLPVTILEIFVWLICFGFIFLGKLFNPSVAPFIALPGCLGIIGAYAFTLSIHSKKKGDPKLAIQILLWMCLLVWGTTAMVYQSSMIGFMTILALEGALGFSFIALPLCYFIGFNSKAAIPRAMSASLILILIYSFVNITNMPIGYFAVFETGVMFLGTFVYFVGLLIVSNIYYHSGGFYTDEFKKGPYILCNILAIVSGISALLFGSVFPGLGYLQGVGGTFFMLILLEKYYEIPWRGHGYTWSLFGLGLILYGMALFIRTHPKYFVFG